MKRVVERYVGGIFDLPHERVEERVHKVVARVGGNKIYNERACRVYEGEEHRNSGERAEMTARFLVFYGIGQEAHVISQAYVVEKHKQEITGPHDEKNAEYYRSKRKRVVEIPVIVDRHIVLHFAYKFVKLIRYEGKGDDHHRHYRVDHYKKYSLYYKYDGMNFKTCSIERRVRFMRERVYKPETDCRNDEYNFHAEAIKKSQHKIRGKKDAGDKRQGRAENVLDRLMLRGDLRLAVLIRSGVTGILRRIVVAEIIVCISVGRLRKRCACGSGAVRIRLFTAAAFGAFGNFFSTVDTEHIFTSISKGSAFAPDCAVSRALFYFITAKRGLQSKNDCVVA